MCEAPEPFALLYATRLGEATRMQHLARQARTRTSSGGLIPLGLKDESVLTGANNPALGQGSEDDKKDYRTHES